MSRYIYIYFLKKQKAKENVFINTITTTNLSVVGSGPMRAPVENEDRQTKLIFPLARDRETENIMPG